MLKINLLLCCIIGLSSLCQAQKKAVTENGDEVILYDDGTWKYTKAFDQSDSSFTTTNPVSFSKSSSASFLLKLRTGEAGVWINPKKWSFSKNPANPNADFEFEYKGLSLEGVIIAEPAEISLESYEKIALINGREAAPDLHIVHKEYRTVNGLKLLYLQMEGTQVGVKFSYCGYYYSSAGASAQFVVTAYSNILKKHIPEIEELLNGFSAIGTAAPDSLHLADTAHKTVIDTLAQGAYSPYSNCKKYFEGKWSYLVNGKKVEVERNFARTVEYTDNRKYYFVYSNKWLDDCKYDLVFKKTNKPGFTLIKPGEIITVEILQIDAGEMSYSTLFRGETRNGGMQRMK